MRNHHFMAALALERCRRDLSHLHAVAHLALPGGTPAPETKTVLALLQAMSGELKLIEESLDKDISAATE